MKINPFITFLLTGILAVVYCNAQNTGNKDYEMISIETKGVKKAFADLELPAGFIEITGGTRQLVESKFYLERGDWIPVFNYEVTNNIGYLEIDYPENNSFHYDHNKESREIEWQLTFNRNIPMEMELDFGAGKGDFDFNGWQLESLEMDVGAGEFDIDLRNTPLKDFDFNGGAGEARIDLSGNWKQSLNASLNCGIGELTIYLPAETGVEVHVTGLLGEVNVDGLKKEGRDYYNKTYGNSPNELEIDINGGIGSIKLIVKQ